MIKPPILFNSFKHANSALVKRKFLVNSIRNIHEAIACCRRRCGLAAAASSEAVSVTAVPETAIGTTAVLALNKFMFFNNNVCGIDFTPSLLV